MSSELSREEAALACALHAMGWHQHYTNCVEQAKVTIRNAPESIRSALSGGGGGEKATDGTFGDIVRPEWIDVPFETEPNRPILLASAAEHLRAYAVSQERCAAWNARERDALKAELAEAKNAVKTEYHRGYGDYRRDLDAALARVNELEAAQERIMAVWMNLDINAMVSALQDASVRIKYIRDAAGAQP